MSAEPIEQYDICPGQMPYFKHADRPGEHFWATDWKKGGIYCRKCGKAADSSETNDER